MSTTIALVALGAASLVTVLSVVVVARRRRARASRRLAALTEIVGRIDAAVSSLTNGLAAHRAPPERDAGSAPTTTVDGDLPGRAGLLWALATSVAEARSHGLRLAAAVVRAGDDDATSLATRAQSVADVPVYAVGPRAVALVLPGLGRADALGLLAQIEAECPSSGRAVELAPEEDAVELAARLLGPGRAPDGTRPGPTRSDRDYSSAAVSGSSGRSGSSGSSSS